MLAYVQAWTEYERGWGCRPDGYTISRTPEDFQKYFEAQRERERREYGGRVPDCYSTPEGELLGVEVPEGLLGLLPPEGETVSWLPSEVKVSKEPNGRRVLVKK